MGNDTSPLDRTALADMIEIEPSNHSVADEEEPWSKKSFGELERDADQLLEDIRNIGSNYESSSKASKDSTNASVIGAVSTQDANECDAATKISDSSDCQTSPPMLIHDNSPLTVTSPNDIDDDSLRGELERLDSVASAIRLSLDGKSFSNLQDSITSPISLQPENDFVESTSNSQHSMDKSASNPILFSEEKRADVEMKSAHCIVSLSIALLFIVCIWVRSIHIMFVESQCEILDGDGMVRWPICASLTRK